jgi:hypothetical protein
LTIAAATTKTITRLICSKNSSINLSSQLLKRLLIARSISSAPASGAPASSTMIRMSRKKHLTVSSRMTIQ